MTRKRTKGQGTVDFRVNVGFFRHIKTRKLRQALGAEGIVSLLQLWGYAAENAPDGNLGKITDEDLSLCAEWHGDPKAFPECLRTLAFLSPGNSANVRLNDWSHHQAWLAGRADRVAWSKAANESRWNKAPKGSASESRTESDRDPGGSPNGIPGGPDPDSTPPSLSLPSLSPPSPTSQEGGGGGDSSSLADLFRSGIRWRGGMDVVQSALGDLDAAGVPHDFIRSWIGAGTGIGSKPLTARSAIIDAWRKAAPQSEPERPCAGCQAPAPAGGWEVLEHRPLCPECIHVALYGAPRDHGQAGAEAVGS